jgi:hypothetical protein
MFALCCLGFSLGSRLRFEPLDLRIRRDHRGEKI